MGDIHQPECVRISDRISFLVLDRGTLHALARAPEWVREGGAVDIPAGMATALLLTCPARTFPPHARG